jgi:hypothetical protein
VPSAFRISFSSKVMGVVYAYYNNEAAI